MIVTGRMTLVRIYAALAVGMWLMACTGPAPDERPVLIPAPQKTIWGDGTYRLPERLQLGIADTVLIAAAGYVNEVLAPYGTVAVDRCDRGDIVLELDSAALPPEGYRLSVTHAGVRIGGGSYRGVVNGIATLRQLLPAKAGSGAKIPYAEIADRPAFGWRGVMLDVSRHFFDKEEIFTLLDQMARQSWFEYDHWESRKFGTYRNQFSVKCGADGKLSYWLGVGMVAYGKSRPSDTAKLEFNPNKVGGERSLLWLLRQLWSRAKLREGCELKQWDLACDWPEPREWYSLRKDARLYEEVMRFKSDRTQYLGERNKPGRCKLYNKQMESGLTSPLTRLEITVEGLAGPHQVAALWPTVYRMADVQGDAEIAALNDTDRFIFATLLDSPDRLNELGRRKRARFAGLLEKCRYRVEFDPQAYARVLADVAQYAQAPDPHDSAASPRWEWPGVDPEYQPLECWPIERVDKNRNVKGVENEP